MLITELLLTTDLSALVTPPMQTGPATQLVPTGRFVPAAPTVPMVSVGEACAALPDQVQTQMSQLEGWVKGFFLSAIGVSFFACLIAIAVGKWTNSPRAGQAGAVGLLVVAASAVGYAVGPDILASILGGGC